MEKRGICSSNVRKCALDVCLQMIPVTGGSSKKHKGEDMDNEAESQAKAKFAEALGKAFFSQNAGRLGGS